MILDKDYKANPVSAEDESTNVKLRREMQSFTQDYDVKGLPSNSKCRKSKTISQSEYDQMVSLRAKEEMLHRAKKERTSKNAKESPNHTKEQVTSSAFKKSFKSFTLRKYGAIMICQW